MLAKQRISYLKAKKSEREQEQSYSHDGKESKDGPLHFKGKRLDALDFNLSNNMGANSVNPVINARRIKSFQIHCSTIPDFLVLTGANGSGKTYLLEAIRANLPPALQLMFVNADDVEKFSFYSTSSGYSLSSMPDDDFKELVDNTLRLIRGNSLDFSHPGIFQTQSYKAKQAQLLASYLSNVIDDLESKQDDDIKAMIISQRSMPHSIDLSKEPDYGFKSIVITAIETRKEAEKKLYKELKQSQKIPDLYEFWLELNRGERKEDFMLFIKNERDMDDLIKKYIKVKFPMTNPIDELNKLFPESFPYKLVERSGDIYCYPRNLEFNDESDLNNRVLLEHLSSGQVLIIKFASLVFYNQGMRASREAGNGMLVTKPDIILLDEPDRHLDPELCKIFFDYVYEVLVRREKIQVIMTTHRIDTIALAPEDKIFVIKKTEEKYHMERCHKLLAMARLTKNLRDFTNFYVKVYTESSDDALFYSSMYRLFQAIESKFARDVRFLSRRWQPEFHSVCVGKKGGGGCTALEPSLKKDMVAYQNLASIIDGAISSKAASYFHPLTTLPFSIVDDDWGNNMYDYKDSQVCQRFFPLPRHSLENFMYDPFILISALRTPEVIDDFIGNAGIRVPLKKIKAACDSCNTYPINAVQKKEIEEGVKEYFDVVLNLQNEFLVMESLSDGIFKIYKDHIKNNIWQYSREDRKDDKGKMVGDINKELDRYFEPDGKSVSIFIKKNWGDLLEASKDVEGLNRIIRILWEEVQTNVVSIAERNNYDLKTLGIQLITQEIFASLVDKDIKKTLGGMESLKPRPQGKAQEELKQAQDKSEGAEKTARENLEEAQNKLDTVQEELKKANERYNEALADEALAENPKKLEDALRHLEKVKRKLLDAQKKREKVPQDNEKKVEEAKRQLVEAKTKAEETEKSSNIPKEDPSIYIIGLGIEILYPCAFLNTRGHNIEDSFTYITTKEDKQNFEHYCKLKDELHIMLTKAVETLITAFKTDSEFKDKFVYIPLDLVTTFNKLSNAIRNQINNQIAKSYSQPHPKKELTIDNVKKYAYIPGASISIGEPNMNTSATAPIISGSSSNSNAAPSMSTFAGNSTNAITQTGHPSSLPYLLAHLGGSIALGSGVALAARRVFPIDSKISLKVGLLAAAAHFILNGSGIIDVTADYINRVMERVNNQEANRIR